MLGAFVPVERVFDGFGRRIGGYFEPRREGLRPGAIGAFPFCRLLCRRQHSSYRFGHAYTVRSFPQPVLFAIPSSKLGINVVARGDPSPVQISPE